MAGRGRFSKLIGGAMAGAGLAAGYILAIRPRILTWGATDGEVKRPLLGDDLVRDAKMEATHAITINRPAGEVWPWLVQIGRQRAGWYSYDGLHRLMGIAGSLEDDRRSAEHVLLQLQDLKVGDVVEIAPDVGYSVVDIQPGRALVLNIAVDASIGQPLDPGEEMPARYLASSWTWFLDPIDDDATRLIVRIRMDYNPSLANALMIRAVIEPGSFIMERRTLLGIKERVEGAAQDG
ncbi:MAG: hypothetical protein PVG25_10960 [Anaerolineae bacterium]|jgi:hypothetical protein